MLKITKIELSPKEIYISNLVTIKISLDNVYWQDLKNNINNWKLNNSFKNWSEVKNYVP